MEPGVCNQCCHLDSDVFVPPRLPGFVRFFAASLVVHLVLLSGFAALRMNLSVASHRSEPIEVELSVRVMERAAAPSAAVAPRRAPLLTPATRVAQPQPVTERVSPKQGAVPTTVAVQPASASAAAVPVSAPSVSVTGTPAGIVAGGSANGVTTGSGPTNGGGGGTAGEVRDVAFGGANGPSFLSRVLPTYPLAARRMGREGKVLLRLTLDERGKLIYWDVLENPGYGFADAAVEAVRKSRFLPAQGGDRPLACRVRLPIRFALRSGD